MPKVDLSFPVMGGQIPGDHGYLIYSAVSRLLPAAHQAVRQADHGYMVPEPDNNPTDGYGIHPIRGRQLGGRTLQLTEHSRLVIRTEAEHFLLWTSPVGIHEIFCSVLPEPELARKQCSTPYSINSYDNSRHPSATQQNVRLCRQAT